MAIRLSRTDHPSARRSPSANSGFWKSSLGQGLDSRDYFLGLAPLALHLLTARRGEGVGRGPDDATRPGRVVTGALERHHGRDSEINLPGGLPRLLGQH